MSSLARGITAYADCFSGISGDMFLAALLDAGLPLEQLETDLAGLKIPGFELSLETRTCCGIRARALRTCADGGQPPRTWPAIRRLLEDSPLAGPVKTRALAVFRLLAEVEADIHGLRPEEVHFHELGAVDTLVDIVGTIAGLEYLGVERLTASPLPLSRGWVRCGHGELPLPAPAVCRLVEEIPVYGVDLDCELVTPTGAALLKTLAHGFGPLPPMTVTATGYGAGSRLRPDGRPNLFRLILGRGRQIAEAREVEVIETHIDDMPPEWFPLLAERLADLGALDFSLAPLQMKKGRPGFLLRVIAPFASAWELKQCILAETTTTGLRYRNERRLTLPRVEGIVECGPGTVRVKKVETPRGPVLYPEYEDCRRLAEEKNLPLREIYAAIGRCDPETFIADSTDRPGK